jgi:hypothetical protein
MLHNFLLVQFFTHFGDAPVEPEIWMVAPLLFFVPAFFVVRAGPNERPRARVATGSNTRI